MQLRSCDAVLNWRALFTVDKGCAKVVFCWADLVLRVNAVVDTTAECDI